MKPKENVFLLFILLFSSINFNIIYSVEEIDGNLTNSLNYTNLNILIDKLNHEGYIHVDERWSIPILISTILTIVLTIILAIIIFLLQDMNVKRDILHISSIGLINEFNDHLVALNKGKKTSFKDKEGNKKYFVNEYFSTGIYESILSSGNISHLPSKLQFSIIEIYERIKYHNLIINNINHLYDTHNLFNINDKKNYNVKALRYCESLAYYENGLSKTLDEIKKDLKILQVYKRNLRTYIRSREKILKSLKKSPTVNDEE